MLEGRWYLKECFYKVSIRRQLWSKNPKKIREWLDTRVLSFPGRGYREEGKAGSQIHSLSLVLTPFLPIPQFHWEVMFVPPINHALSPPGFGTYYFLLLYYSASLFLHQLISTNSLDLSYVINASATVSLIPVPPSSPSLDWGPFIQLPIAPWTFLTTVLFTLYCNYHFTCLSFQLNRRDPIYLLQGSTILCWISITMNSI